MSLPLVVAITGSTGVIYGVEMLRVLNTLGQETHLIVSEAAGLNLAIETDCDLDYVKGLAHLVYNNKDIGAAVASGSFRTRGMIVAPCTVKTLSARRNVGRRVWKRPAGGDRQPMRSMPVAVLNLMARTRCSFSGRSWLQPPRQRRRSCRIPRRW